MTIAIDIRSTHPHVGKTTIAALLVKTLNEAGIQNVLVANLDKDIGHRLSSLNEALATLKKDQPQINIRDTDDKLLTPHSDKPVTYDNAEALADAHPLTGDEALANGKLRSRIDQRISRLSAVVEENDYVMVDREELNEIECLLEDLYSYRVASDR